MISSDDKPGGPVMQLLASGLQIWVRQQCQSIGSLDIQLQGTGLQLLRGRLAGVQLLARRVIYKDLHFELVELNSGPIQVHSGNLLKGQPLQLKIAAGNVPSFVDLQTGGWGGTIQDPLNTILNSCLLPPSVGCCHDCNPWPSFEFNASMGRSML